MPRLKDNQVPKYGRHRQSGQARVVLNGRHHLLGPHGSKASRQEYDRLIAEWVANGRQGPAAAAGELTVATLIIRFWTHAQGYYRDPDGTQSRELLNFKQALIPLRRLYGTTPAKNFGPLALKAVRQSMINDFEWCRNVVNRQTTRVRQVFKWAVENELVPASVSHALAAVSGLREGRSEARESVPVKAVPEAMVYAIKDHVSRQVWAMVELQWITGMRSGEVVRMRTGDIDTTGALWVYRPRKHKTQHHGHVREIFIGPRARSILEPLIKPNLEAFIFSPADAEAERRARLHADRATPLSCGNKPGSNRRRRPAHTPGARYTVTAYLRAIYAGCEKAGPPPAELARLRVPAAGRKKRATRWETAAELKARLGEKKWAELTKWREEHRWHPHQLRHAAGSRLRKEFGVEAAQVVLGHKTLSVTELYAQKNVDAARKIMGEVG
jgi:integrase